jgi:hypothetical protein
MIPRLGIDTNATAKLPARATASAVCQLITQMKRHESHFGARVLRTNLIQ